ncbi:MAG: VWA domain-containing protein [Leptospiraceae bacterium]|nr:VWA domain-containing protein [Leptospiraceae bacterium]MDW8305485.1 VWA domain-containing protein [Leptospiraceae bacterium]
MSLVPQAFWRKLSTKFTKKSFWLILATAVFLTAAFAFYYTSGGLKHDQAETLFKQGLFLFQQYQFDAASDFFIKALHINNDFVLARRMLGYALYLSGRLDEAFAEWRLILDENHYDPALSLHLSAAQTPPSQRINRWQFLRVIPQERGFRYSLPTYVGTLPNHNIFFLSLGLVDFGSIHELSQDKGFQKVIRRISGRLRSPVGAAVSEKEIWISDFESDLIHRISLDLEPSLPYFSRSQALGGSGSGDALFHGPAGIAYCHGFFYVVDQGNNRVQKFDEEGNFILSFSQINESESLYKPFGIACSENKTLLISEPEKSRISEFDSYGNFISYHFEGLLKKPRHITYDKDNHYYLIADEEQGVLISDLETQIETFLKSYEEKGRKESFLRPYAATFDYYGNLFVADYAAHRILQFVPENKLWSNLDVYIENIHALNFPIVHVLVSVRDEKMRYQTHLEDSNFQLFENDGYVGEVSSRALLSSKDELYLRIVVDGSEAMEPYTEAIFSQMDRLLNSLRQKDEAQILSYSNDVYTQSPLTNSRLRLLKGLRDIFSEKPQTKNSSLYGKALFQALNDLLPRPGKRAIIWITPGTIPENQTPVPLEQIENAAFVNHIPLFILNFENPSWPTSASVAQRLQKMSHVTGGDYFFAFKTIPDFLEKFRQSPLNRYLLSYRSRASRKWKGQYMEVKLVVNFQGRMGAENSGYFIPD